MAKDFQIKWILSAVDLASSTFSSVEKNLNKMTKAYEKADHKAALSARKSAIQAVKFKELAKSQIYAGRAINELNVKTKKAIDLAKIDSAQNLYKIKIKEELAKSHVRVSKAESNSSLALLKNREQEIKSANRLEISNNSLKRSQNQLARSDLSLKRSFSGPNNRSLNDVHSMAATGMTRVAAPTALGVGFGLKNAMEREQLNMRLGLLFGQEEGKAVAKEMKQYSLESALDYKETVKLISDMSIGKENLGLTTTRELIDFTKKIGDVVVTYVGGKDDINEVINQLGQTFMGGKANTRQDLRVMQKHGLPIFNALKQVTGLSFDEMNAKYGAETPAKLVAAAVEYIRAEEKTSTALKVRKTSITQSWQTLTEQVTNVSASFGEMMNQEYGIAKGMRSIADSLGYVDTQLLGIDDKQNHVLKSSIKYGTAMALSVPTLMIALTYADKLGAAMASTSATSQILKTRLAIASGIMSALYLTSVDWGTVMKDLQEGGPEGWIKHLDVIAAGFVTILSTVTLIRNASVVAAMAWTPIILAMAAVGAVGFGAYKGTSSLFGEGGALDADAILNELEKTKARDLNSKGIAYQPNIVDLSKRNANLSKNGGYQQSAIETGATHITNIIKWDGKGAPTVKNKVKKDPHRAPLVMEIGY